MMMVNGNLVGVEVRREEICERGKKRQRISNNGGVIRQEEETCEIGNKILNELIDQCSFKIYPLHKLDGNIYFEKSGGVEADDHMSPKKSLRAAVLKSRFAETISKAAKTMQIVEAVKQSNELEIRRRRQRKVLDDMEKDASENVDMTTTDLETLFGAKGYPNSEALKRLGLRIKDEEEEYELERRRKREREVLEEMEKAAAANVDNTTAILMSLGFSTAWFGYEVGD